MAPQSVPCSAGTLHSTQCAGSSKRAFDRRSCAGSAPEADVEADIGLPVLEVRRACQRSAAGPNAALRRHEFRRRSRGELQHMRNRKRPETHVQVLHSADMNSQSAFGASVRKHRRKRKLPLRTSLEGPGASCALAGAPSAASLSAHSARWRAERAPPRGIARR